MNKKQLKTLQSIFETPTKSDILFSDIEKLLIGLKFQKKERAGSRVSFLKGSDRIIFHRPHPKKVTPKYAIENLRKFLKQLEIEP